MEQWKAIPGYEGLYEASDLGRIRSAEGKTTRNARCTRVWKQRILKKNLTKRPCGTQNESVCLWKNGKHKDYLVSRLVAMTWCDGYQDRFTVNHIDGNTLNNKADNLEWISLSENITHAYKTGLNSNARKCTLTNKSGRKFLFYSLQEASRFLGRNPKYLSTALQKGTGIYASNGDQYDFA